MISRPFESYESYVEAQGLKARTRRADLLAAVEKSVRGFERIFRAAKPYLRPGPILCLGARTGAESVAAARVGFKGSVGIDLHPVGPGVMRGDWHSMPSISDASFPNVYTNSFDHCLMLDAAAAEIRRVLTPDGFFYLMASDKGQKTRARSDAWLRETGSEAMYWDHSDELCAAVVAFGFRVVTSWRQGVWGHYVLRPVR